MQASASHAGKRARAEDASNSSASSHKDQGSKNETAKKDHPEAPGPVIGMNDERGGVSFLCYCCLWESAMLMVGAEGSLGLWRDRRDKGNAWRKGASIICIAGYRVRWVVSSP